MASDTRTRLLDAAEYLLAHHGATGTSVRDVLGRAQVSNTAAVGYYFGGKDALVAEVERRVVDEVNQGRRDGLTSLADDAGPEELVEVWVRPLVQMRCAGRGPAAAAVFTRIFEADSEMWDRNGVTDVVEVTRLYRERAAALLGRRDDEEEFWRWKAMTAVTAAYATGELEEAPVQPTPADAEAHLRRLVPALAALLRVALH